MIQGESRIAWVANKLASYLKNPLRDYVVRVIVLALTNNSGWLIDTLNTNLSSYWDLIMRTASLKMEDLPKLAQHHITQAESVDENEVELVWREKLPLGLNILTNDESGLLKVVDFPRGTQARQVAQSKQLDPDMFKGSTIVAVNGRKYGPDNQPELFSALRDPSRPKAIMLRLASKDDLNKMDELTQNNKKGSKTSSRRTPADENEGTNIISTVIIVDEGDIGIKFATSRDNFSLVVRDHVPAGRTVNIPLNSLLSHVNDTLVLGEKGEGKMKAISLLEKVGAKRPLSLSFVKPYLYSIVVEKGNNGTDSIGGPAELLFTEVKPATSSKENKIVLKDFGVFYCIVHCFYCRHYSIIENYDYYALFDFILET